MMLSWAGISLSLLQCLLKLFSRAGLTPDILQFSVLIFGRLVQILLCQGHECG